MVEYVKLYYLFYIYNKTFGELQCKVIKQTYNLLSYLTNSLLLARQTMIKCALWFYVFRLRHHLHI